MTEFHSPNGKLPHIPDNLTVAQFILDEHNSRRPVRGSNVPWLIDDDTGRKIYYEEVRSRTFGLANALFSSYGIREDCVVLIFSPNHVDYPIAVWATHRLGGVVSGANPNFGADELLFQTTTTNAQVLIVHPSFLDVALSVARVADIPEERIILFDVVGQPETHEQRSGHLTIEGLIQKSLRQNSSFTERRLGDGEARRKLAFLSFSSGTTGKPKAIGIPHFAVIANVIQLATHSKVSEDYTKWKDQRFRPGDVAVGVLPFYHIYGLLFNLQFVLFCGMSIVVTPKYNFVGMLQSIVRHRITHLFLVPPQAVALCKHPASNEYNLSHVRFLTVGAAPTSPEINDMLFRKFPNAQIGQCYGMTETSTVVTMFPVSQRHGVTGSAGQLLPGVVARVVKPNGSIAERGELGELHVRCPSVALGYTNDEKATKETFVDGWVRTGDEVYINKDSEVFVVDRIKEILKVKGFQVAPAELEGCLLNHPDVSDTCVVGVPDEYAGEVPLAYVVLGSEGAKRIKNNPRGEIEMKESITKHVSDHKVKYKWLVGGVEFIDAIPKNPSGKLLRRVLRDRAKTINRFKTKTKL